MTDTQHAHWTRRWTFVLAATGSAVGLGNIWKFPYITGEYGGGAFVLVYLACIALVGVPVMIAEILIGRAGRTDPIHSMLRLSREVAGSPAWSIVGIAGVLAGAMILMFYSVVAGWALDYIWQSASGSYAGAPATDIEAAFGALTGDSNRQLLAHSLFILLTAGVVGAGVTRGIGSAVEILMPLLFVFLLVLLGYSWATGDFDAALNFMFAVDFSKLSAEAVLVALGHAFFTLSLGMGAIMAYGSYMPGDSSIGKTVITVAALDTIIALVAGMAIFPLVFANELAPGSGPGLMFVSLPIAFGNMPAGTVFGTLFFVLVSIAALSSSISLIEPGVAWLEKQGLRRSLGTAAIAIAGWVGGLLCIRSSAVFDALDHITANYMLPLGGLLIAVFVGWFMRHNRVQLEAGIGSYFLFELWYFALRFIAPAGVVLIFLHSLGILKF